ncbi:hypothetical protein [Armatimonas rosea]|uniref:Uncharacterized protein n=1 Tax=Armatimonas rosea TaxID=685828 RepID=A0A7W9SUI6_ARMRO|nr:hypothetical protein [Armatimonas rosea]MBB6053075.1 hypothetical protein [Armatimonas rosea]
MIPILATPAALLAQAPTLAFPESLAWNPETRGPLLIVLPGDERSLQLATFGSLSAYIPRERTELRWENLPKPDLYDSLSAPEKYELLEASLTDKQWEKLCSSAGLGLSDLSRDQRKLFLLLIPRPFPLTRGTESVTLSETERTQTRLRLSRRFGYHFTNANGAYIQLPSEAPSTPAWQLGAPAQRSPVGAIPGLVLGDNNSNTANVFSTTDIAFVTSLTEISGVTIARASSLSNFRSGGSFGATFTTPQSNSAKPGQLDFTASALDKPVSLKDAKTVGELVRRCGETTGNELFCDPRYADRQVHLRGTQARTGDVLQALARGVAGTWRKVGPGYVLTDDLTPLAIRMGRIHDWLTAAQDALETARAGAEERSEAQKAALLRWHPDDPSRPTGTLAERLAAFEAQWQQQPFLKTPDGGWRPNELTLRLSDLPDTLRAQAEQQLTKAVSSVFTDRVVYEPQTVLELLPPSYPPIRVSWAAEGYPRGHRPETADEPEILPAPLRQLPRTLAVAIQSPQDAERAVQAAKAQGFAALWVQVGLGDTALLAAAVKAGQAAQLPVHALVRPLRAPQGTDTTVEAKRSPLYLRPDALETQAAVLPRLRTLAATPGLAGLALTDLYPTGYQRGTADWKELLGYSENLRLACLRQQGPDPVDLTSARLDTQMLYSGRVSFSVSLSMGGVSKPTLNWYAPSGWLWDSFYRVRQDAAEGFGDQLLTALKSAYPHLALTRLARDGRHFAPTQARLQVPSSTDSPSKARFRQDWHGVFNTKTKPESIVFDASDQPLSQVLAALSQL